MRGHCTIYFPPSENGPMVLAMVVHLSLFTAVVQLYALGYIYDALQPIAAEVAMTILSARVVW
jgi:hypothetical protein